VSLDRHTQFELAMEDFVQRLKDFRAARGLSQTRLAQLLDVSPRVYNRWERGLATPRLDTVVKIADILRVSLDELAGRTSPSTTAPHLHNPKLHLLYSEIDKLSDEDQQALAILLDSLVKRSQIDRVLAK